MKRVWIFITLVFFALGSWGMINKRAAAQSEAGAKATEEELKLGRDLFNKKEGLGVKFACILCHQKDKAIKKDKVIQLGDKLPDVINMHILEKSKGTKPLDKNSKEMKALVAYIVHEHSI